MDFTIIKYIQEAFPKPFNPKKYHFQTFSEFLAISEQKAVILRHDVDTKKNNSLRFAQIQNKYGIKGSYYFRMVPQSFDKDIIRQIADLGHEIGYHYEDMISQVRSLAVSGSKLKEEEIYMMLRLIFWENLRKLRSCTLQKIHLYAWQPIKI
ncbi:MAG: OST-HTH/LOTUS domain-containing protein [Bacteroidales bacterium]